MALLQKTLLFIAVWNQVEAFEGEAVDYTFGQFCNRPPNFGTGKLIASDSCEITYHVELDDDVAAANFCEQQHAYSLKSYKRKGDLTICTIESYFKCGESEVLIDRTCYVLKQENVYIEALRSSCGSKYALHKVKSTFEQKWLSTFYSKHHMLWIANDPRDSNTKHLRFALQDEVLVSKTGRMEKSYSEVMAIVTSIRTHTKIPRGSVVKADRDLSLPVLCSRPAEQLPSYARALMEKINEIGIRTYIKKDRFDKERVFFVLREYFPFDMSEGFEEDKFMVGTKRLHKGCSTFWNGYAASPLDFKNIEDFKEILRKESVNIVSVPGRRQLEKKMDNEGTCTKIKKPERDFFEIVFQNGSSQTAAEDSSWATNNPDRTCGDTPRIALGFSQEGLVDIPAIARHFILCTFGPAPPKVDESAQCHFAATFNEKTKECECKPGTDIKETKRFEPTESERQLKKGRLCVDCELETYHSLVILMDLHYDGERDKKFIEIATHLVFPFFATESYITVMIWYSYYDRQYEGRYGLAKDGDNYDKWRNQFSGFMPRLPFIDSHLSGLLPRREFIWRPRLAATFDAIKKAFNKAPQHRRILIIITSGREYDFGEKYDLGEKVLEVKNAKKAEVFLFIVDNEDFNKDWSAKSSYHVDTKKDIGKQLHIAATNISQQVARNVCLRF